MPLNASTSLPYPVDALTQVFTRKDFAEHISRRAGATLNDFTVSGSTEAAFTVTTTRTVPTDRLPDLVKKFVGATLSVTQRENWSAPTADGSRTADINIEVAGAPVTVTAVQKLITDSEGTTVELNGKVSSSIPFLGPKIASSAEPMLAKVLNLQTSEARTWLDKKQ